MKKLVWDEDVEEVDLGDGDFVSISSALSVKDMARVGAAENRMEISLSLLRHLVRSWRGPSFEHEGTPVPCTHENIDRLEISVATELANKLASRITGERMDDDEKKESTESSSNISVIPGVQTTSTAEDVQSE